MDKAEFYYTIKQAENLCISKLNLCMSIYT
nr:MAG TPA: hypothetical protein [Caudoviricetes sp.]